ncbi:MAG: DUF1573 domain-containing protein [Muribaculaceae bacterium]|nr:DUF1573 domain-containing protein [Muribaculaceae bacterium]
MKSLLTTLLVIVLSFATMSARGKAGAKVGVDFDATTYEFGNVSESGKPVSHTFTYTNTGTTPVAVLWAKTSCGCTEPVYERKPLKPGEKATVKVTFDPKGQRGEVDKDIRLRMRNGAGKSEEITLRLKGAVIPKNKK